MLFNKVCFLFLALSALTASALSGESGTSSFSVSDGSSQQTMLFGVGDSLSDFYLPGKWEYGFESILGRGYNGKDNYINSRALFYWAQRLKNDGAEFNFEGSFGPHQLENQTTKKSDTTPVGNVKLEYKRPDRYETSLDVTHDYSFLDGVHPGGISRYLRTTELNPWARYYWNERNRTNFRGVYQFLNDGNVKHDSELASTYAVIHGKHSLWLGGGVQELTFKENTDQYWSPTRNFGYGPRIESEWKLSDRLKSCIRFSGNRIYDKDPKAWGHGYYLYSELEYSEDPDGIKIALVYERIETNVNHFLWFMNQLNVRAEAVF